MKLISNSKEKKKKKGKTNCNKRNASALFFIKQKEQLIMYRRMNTFYLSTNDITHDL